MRIKLVRHAQSESNIGQVNASMVGDHNVDLTEEGHLTSIDLGRELVDFLIPSHLLLSPKTLAWQYAIKGVCQSDSLHYCSPYKRTRRTLEGLRIGAANVIAERHLTEMKWQHKIYEDPRLREVEWGLGIDDPDYWTKIEKMKKEYGSFYIRRPNGESCADCYDRCAAFIGTMMRQIERKKATKVVIVSHGLTMRCFVACFMHLTVEQFESLRNPLNCEVITLSNEVDLDPQFTCGSWAVEGLRFRN